MPTDEFWFRIITFIPLLYITYQVVCLHRILKSKAWTRIMIGFLIFTFVVAYQIIGYLTMMPRLLIGLGGYMFIAIGFRTLRSDLDRVLQPRSKEES